MNFFLYFIDLNIKDLNDCYYKIDRKIVFLRLLKNVGGRQYSTIIMLNIRKNQVQKLI